MSAVPRLRMSSDEFLEWELRQETKHEFYRGEVFPMDTEPATADGSASRTAIGVNAAALLSASVERIGGRVFGEEVRVYSEAQDLLVEPTLSITASEARLGAEGALLNPLVLVEVASASAYATDRRSAWSVSPQIPSVEAYVLIEQDAPGVHVYSRDGDGWRAVQTDEGEARIPCLDAALSLAALYDGVAFPGPGERTRPTPGV